MVAVPMRPLLLVLFLSCRVCSLPQYYEVQDNSTVAHITFNFKAIYPGTKWCGAGNVAANKNDLGQLVREDSCCRDHDSCADFIRPESSKHGLRNPSTSTRFACSCESKLYLCLKAIRSRVANQLGHIYFNVLGEDCFKKSNHIIGCRLSVPDKLTRKRCMEYITDKSRPKVYQFFNVPMY